MTQNELLTHYISRYQEGRITPDEWRALQDMLREEGHQEALRQLMDDQLTASLAQPEQTYTDLAERIKQVAAKTTDRPRARTVALPRRWWAAAAVVVALAMGAWLWRAGKHNTRSATIARTHAIQPGKEGAVLTLANGTQVLLDTVKNGVVALQGGTTAKVVNGALLYDGNASEGMFNTLSTPKGRQFHIRLPDSTDVWLNAASSIRYPLAFTGAERRVEITGEVYLEVAQNARMPFRVNVHQQAAIEVLGTHFNVNAYANEPLIATTLLEGAVRVRKLGAGAAASPGVVLQPGQQARQETGNAGKPMEVVAADAEKVLAWKNGLFYFNGLSLKEAMRQIERWYDVEVKYEGQVPDVEFVGQMSRNVSLPDLLNGLKIFNIHCRIENRTLIVSP